MKFIPEERAKKLSFDRMIFKLEPTEETLKVWDHDFEYRFDITLVSSQVLDCLFCVTKLVFLTALSSCARSENVRYLTLIFHLIK